MLTRVEITNYRGFKSYRMEGLARVNLLVGKNNSGKTALLEGIQFLTSGGDGEVIAEIAERRGELAFRVTEGPFRRADTSVDIAHLFHGHALTLNRPFSISGDNGYEPITVTTVIRKNTRADEGSRGADRSSAETHFLRILVGSESKDDRKDSDYRISPDGAVDLSSPSRIRRNERSGQPRGRRVYFVGPDSLGSRDLAVMWDEVTIRGQEADVAAAMRIIEPHCESVHPMTGMLVSGYFPSRGGFVVGMKGHELRVPLGSMGDGMRRLMSLATALVYTKEGCLFVDEIDSGLHYLVMPDMWKLVTLKAISLNTQVFATTHSWDCIEGLSALCQRDPTLMQSVAIHKIDRAIPHSVGFTGEAIVRMVKSDIDPR